jgi:penicillin-binding protein 1A
MMLLRLLRFSWHLAALVAISVVVSGLVVAMGACLGVLTYVSAVAATLPPAVIHPHRATVGARVYDAHGTLIAQFPRQELRDEPVQLSEIPLVTQAAFIATEDQRFYRHHGLDFRRIAGAMVVNFNAARVVQGASTITQQLAKNMFLTQERSIERKIKDMLMALQLERNYSKRQLLEFYLNEISFGHRTVGIAAASKVYFGKPVQQLDLAESAILAGIPRRPTQYSPFSTRHPNAWKDRQRTVLQLMEEQRYITPADRQKAVAKPVQFASRTQPVMQWQAPYFAAYISKWLGDRFGQGAIHDDYQVYTTLDLEVQALAEKHFLAAPVFRSHPLGEKPELEGAFVVMKPSTGAVLAMVGGRDYRHSQFNRAAQARRQPGSAFKPFLFAAAYEAGFRPDSQVSNSFLTLWDEGSRRWYTPANFTKNYSEENVSLSSALARSLNVVAVRLCDALGVSRVMSMARRLGIESPLPAGLAIALGSADVTMLEMVTAYGTIANMGRRVFPEPVTSVEDGRGRIVYSSTVNAKQVVAPHVMATLLATMIGAVENGTGEAAQVEGYQVAGKTGTSQSFHDAWFVGMLPELVVGMQVGFDERKSMGEDRTGGHVCAPVAGNFLREYTQRFKPRATFPRVVVPQVAGY